jgi:hypothetical protein
MMADNDDYEIIDDYPATGVKYLTAEQVMGLFCDEITKDGDGEAICAAGEGEGDDDWEDILLSLTADSGAGNHVLSREDIPGYRINESAGSKAGRGFVGVSGGRIDNEGESELNLLGPNGRFKSTFQIARVNRPLMSIARICDRGHTVLFCKTHASVLDAKQREVCRFARKGNLYMVDVTLKAPPRTPGFTRQGR